MSKRVLVVTTADVPSGRVDSIVRAHTGNDAEVHVVAPASKVSWLDHLTSDEEAARKEASERADATAAVVSSGNVETHVGDADPLQAIADALREYPADEVVLLTAPEQDATWLESDLGKRARERFSVPIVHLTTAA